MVDQNLILGTQILTFRLHMALEGHPLFQSTEEVKPRPGSPRKLLLASALEGGLFTEDGSTWGSCASSPDVSLIQGTFWELELKDHSSKSNLCPR